jgi:polar amino acid transport system substrate-binding protein
MLLAALMLMAVACGEENGGTTATPTTGGGGSPQPGATVAGVPITEDPELNAMLPQAILDADRVRVASDVPYPPWEMFTEPGSDQITGVDYDLGQAIGAKLGVPFEFQVAIFDSIIPALQAGRSDIVMSAMYDNAERQEVLDFVNYGYGGTGILVPKGNPEGITTLDDLSGKRVAVQAGTTQLQLLQSLNEQLESEGRQPVEILRFPKDSDAQLAVRSGRAVADVTDGPGGAYVAETTDDGTAFELVRDPGNPSGYDTQPFGIGVLKSNRELTDAIQAALQQLMDDGTYLKILEKYGLESVAVDEATINIGK